MRDNGSMAHSADDTMPESPGALRALELRTVREMGVQEGRQSVLVEAFREHMVADRRQSAEQHKAFMSWIRMVVIALGIIAVGCWVTPAVMVYRIKHPPH